MYFFRITDYYTSKFYVSKHSKYSSNSSRSQCDAKSNMRGRRRSTGLYNGVRTLLAEYSHGGDLEICSVVVRTISQDIVVVAHTATGLPEDVQRPREI